jgi:hypothetical protein
VWSIRSSARRTRSTSAAFRPRWPSAWRTACSALFVVFLLAACGGGDGDPASGPVLPADVGAALAAQADAVEQALAAGDPLTARAAAEELVAAVEAAIARGDVPGALTAQLRAGAQRLLLLIPDPEAEAPAPETEPPPAPPPPTTTEEEPPPPPEDEDEDSDEDEDACAEFEQAVQDLEAQLAELDEDDPARGPIEGQLESLRAQLAECRAGDEDGDGDE